MIGARDRHLRSLSQSIETLPDDGPMITGVPACQWRSRGHTRALPPSTATWASGNRDLACDHCYGYEQADQSWRRRPKCGRSRMKRSRRRRSVSPSTLTTTSCQPFASSCTTASHCSRASHGSGASARSSVAVWRRPVSARSADPHLFDLCVRSMRSLRSTSFLCSLAARCPFARGIAARHLRTYRSHGFLARAEALPAPTRGRSGCGETRAPAHAHRRGHRDSRRFGLTDPARLAFR